MNLPALKHHAKMRIRERFNIKVGGEQLFLERHFPKADRVCAVYNVIGELSAHYVTGDIIFVVDEKTNEVVTIKHRLNNITKPAQQSFKQRIKLFIKAEVSNITKTGERLERQVAELEQAIREELPELQAQLKRTRSIAKKFAIKGRILALDERYEELPEDIRMIRDDIRKQINGALAHY